MLHVVLQAKARQAGGYAGRFQSFNEVAPPAAPSKFNYNSWDTQIEMSGNSFGGRSQGIKSAASSAHSLRDGHR